MSPPQPQATAAQADPTPTTAQPERRAEITRVIVLGTPLQFEMGKLWPQGEAQAKVAKLAMEVWLLERWLDNEQNHVHREQYATYASELKQKRPLLKAERDKLRVAEQPIECVVSQITELAGDMTAGMPARVEIIGQPFGLWAERQLSATMRFAVDACGILKRYPLEQLVDYVRELEASETPEEADEDDDGEEDEETDDDGEEASEEEEESAGDMLVEAALHAIPQATIELRDGGSVAVLPIAAWERISAAADAWAEEQKEDAEAQEDEEGDEEGDEDEVEGEPSEEPSQS